MVTSHGNRDEGFGGIRYDRTGTMAYPNYLIYLYRGHRPCAHAC